MYASFNHHTGNYVIETRGIQHPDHEATLRTLFAHPFIAKALTDEVKEEMVKTCSNINFLSESRISIRNWHDGSYKVGAYLWYRDEITHERYEKEIVYFYRPENAV